MARMRPASAAALASLLAACADPALELPGIRNLVLISIDTLRADHLGCYGNTVVETPHMDRLAREGVLFDAHSSNAPSTLCSHTTLMTGTYPHTHGIPRNGFQVPEDNLMLAEVLADAGFHTSAVIGAFPLRAKFQFDQGFLDFDDQESKRSGLEVNEAVRGWLDRRPAANLDTPFFLFVHYWDPHYPYDPPPPYDSMYRSEDLKLERTIEEIEIVRANMYAGKDESARGEALRGLYAGEVSYVDAHIGELLDLLEEHHILDNSLLVLTSDHGEAMDEHWEFWDHGESNYETSVHTPLIMRLPGAALAGSRWSDTISTVDVMPTILELLGIELPDSIEGASFASLLTGHKSSPRPPVFIEGTKPHTDSSESGQWTNARKCRAIRQGRWKLIHRPLENSLELYDLGSDPLETRDLLLTEADRYSEIVGDLSARLKAWSEFVPSRIGEHDLSEKTQRQLRSLGYFEE